MLAGKGGQYRLPGPLINWPLESTGLRFIWIAARWRRGSTVSYQKAALLQTFVCWVINLPVSELSFEVSFALSLPFPRSVLTARGREHRRKGGPSFSGIHPYTTHLITWSELCLMMSALSGGGPANRETHWWFILTCDWLEHTQKKNYKRIKLHSQLIISTDTWVLVQAQ